MAYDYQYQRLTPICAVPGRGTAICPAFQYGQRIAGKCSICIFADKYERPEKYVVAQ